DEEDMYLFTVTNLTIQNVYVHDSGDGLFQMGFNNNVLVENSDLARNTASLLWHSEPWAEQGSKNVTARYNVFEDFEGTGGIVILARGGPATADNWSIYGNVFMYHNGNPYNRHGLSNGSLACINLQTCSNFKFYNNSLINLPAPVFTNGIQFNEASANS